MRLIVIVSLTVFAFMPNKIFAENYKGYINCGNYLDAVDNDDYYIYTSQVSWAMGFISGLNAMSQALEIPGELRKVPDFKTIKYTLEKHCRDNPMDWVNDAVFQMVSKL